MQNWVSNALFAKLSLSSQNEAKQRPKSAFHLNTFVVVIRLSEGEKYLWFFCCVCSFCKQASAFENCFLQVGPNIEEAKTRRKEDAETFGYLPTDLSPRIFFDV